MRWPLPRPVYLTLENDDIDLKPLGVEELLRPVLERALFATKAMGAAIALRGGTEMVCMATQGTAPDLGMRLDQKFGFSGMCVRKGRILSATTRRRIHELIVRPASGLALDL